MIYIDPVPNASGAYPNSKCQPFPGCILLDENQSATFFQHNGFVIVEQAKDGTVTVTPNLEAWEAWKEAEAAKSQPDPEPTLEERVKTMETGKAEQADVDELHEALDMILTGYTGEEAADEAGTA